MGAQTIPREISLAPPGSVTGLWFSPIPEMATLHTSTAPDLDENVSLVPGPASRRVFAPKDGLHCHIKAVITLPTDQQQSCVVTLTVRDSASGTSQGSLAIEVAHTKGQRTVTFGSKMVTISSASSEMAIEIFVDGPVRDLSVHVGLDVAAQNARAHIQIVELFANGGERTMSTNSGNPESLPDTSISMDVSGAPARIQMQVWAMNKSIFGPE